MPVRSLRICADDFGYCGRRNEGILVCAQAGRINSVSVLVNGRMAKEGVDALIQRCPGILLGLHFNLTEGRPLSQVTSIVGADGNFLGKFPAVSAALEGKWTAGDVETELRAQLTAFKDLAGRPPDHLDGHNHIHVVPGVRDVVARVAAEVGVDLIRLPLEHGLPDTTTDFLKSVCSWARESREIFAAKGLRFTEGFLGLSTMGQLGSLSTLDEALSRQAGCSSLEWMVHPGYRGIQGQGGCWGTEGPDDFGQSASRELEMDLLLSPELPVLLERHGLAMGIPTS
ncbi:YDJC [Cordylochernes scorpioides]|uniref:Carbohydrate deacetylase n=1 Tax=Cordylochernes scorpioides TaxID=51811 RepID=A0ABY6L298_9ARAC|nr:YDJC [Cordylochernes scorpioides]